MDVMAQPDHEEDADEAALEPLLTFVRDARGFDFTGYKRSTLTRRIRKRMQEVGTATYPDYRDRLESSAEEFGNLFNTILINVTSFFRDAEAWTYLQREVVPELLVNAEGAEEVRVWSVAGVGPRRAAGEVLRTQRRRLRLPPGPAPPGHLRAARHHPRRADLPA
jgi:two-component system CheB/CheR fusion protein